MTRGLWSSSIADPSADSMAKGTRTATAALWVAAVGALALVARRSRPGWLQTPAPVPVPLPPLLPQPQATRPAEIPPTVPARFDGTWLPARLTEYHPDAPPSAGKKVLRREGGPRDRMRQPLVTLEQHRADPLRYPFASVAADRVLQGRKVPYGVRVYIEALPTDVLRIVDTGQNFYGDGKKIRIPGHEPLDIATAWPGKSQKLSGKKTRFKIDWTDTLPEPRPRVS